MYYIQHIKCVSVSTPRQQRLKDGGVEQHEASLPD